MHLSLGRKGTRPDLGNIGNESLSSYNAIDSCAVNHLTYCQEFGETNDGNLGF